MKINKNLIKACITDVKRVDKWGDCHLTEDGYYFPFEGVMLKVKLFGLFWITYKQYLFRIK